MEIFPAIDIINGKAVRLTEGDFDQMKQYADRPVEVALDFEKQGAKNLHMVDLDGARGGENPNFTLVAEVVKKTNLFVEVGGGIRSKEQINAYLSAGVGRVILGTVASENPEFVEDMVGEYGAAIAVSVDAKGDKVASHGWEKVTDLDGVAFCQKMASIGVQTLIYTDISKDGKMAGTNLDIYRTLAEQVDADIIASGGITYPEEITTLRDMGIYGAIVGKSLYEKGMTLQKILTLGEAE